MILQTTVLIKQGTMIQLSDSKELILTHKGESKVLTFSDTINIEGNAIICDGDLSIKAVTKVKRSYKKRVTKKEQPKLDAPKKKRGRPAKITPVSMLQ